MNTRIFFALAALILTAACDDGANPAATPTPGARTGVTACGPSECQAGQYCSDNGLGFCTNGCLSDTNCRSNQTCVKASGANEGSCQDTDPTPTPTPDVTSTPPSACEGACDTGLFCGFFDAPSVAVCKAGCAEFPAEVSKAIVDCVDAAQCGSDLSQCFGSECGGSYGCPAGKTCDQDFGTCD